MKLTRIRIENYKSIRNLDVAVPEHGMVISGTNGVGKSTVLEAVKEALVGVGPEHAVTLLADQSRILVDTDEFQVRKLLSRDGKATVTVTTSEGDKKGSPATFLRGIFGGLDPLALFQADPKERRKMILAALPLQVTRGVLEQFAPDLPPDFDTSGHGLDVCERARELYYQRRTRANAEAKAASEAADRAAEAVPMPTAVAPPPTAEAEGSVRALRTAHNELTTRTKLAVQGEERSAKTRAKIAGMRAKAAEITAAIDDVPAEIADDAAKACATADDRVTALQLELDAAISARNELREILEQIHKTRRVAAEAREQAEILVSSAAEQETTLADLTVPAVPPEELDAAKVALEKAIVVLDAAKARDVRDECVKIATAAREAATAKATLASTLDDTVRRLTKDAPALLLEGAEGVQGLSITGDTIWLDGVDIGTLSSAQQLRLAVEISRRMSKGKLLIVDKLETIAEDQRDSFIAAATAGGWQLLASLVTRGERVFGAIELEAPAVAAQ